MLQIAHLMIKERRDLHMLDRTATPLFTAEYMEALQMEEDCFADVENGLCDLTDEDGDHWLSF